MANGATLTLTQDGFRTLHEGLSNFAAAAQEAQRNVQQNPTQSFVFDRLARKRLRPS